MPNFKQISRTSNFTKLFVGDKMHIKEMVKEYRLTDKRFESEAAAVRYFVHVGIAAQSATEDLNNSLDNAIIRNSIKEAVRKELSFHSAHIEKLQNMMEEYSRNNDDNFGDIARRTDTLEAKIDRGFEGIINFLKTILTTSEHALRNIIVLRSIIYVFFLGHKTGRIEPGKENLVKWNKLINLAHEQANKLSVKEIQMLANETLEATVIQKMAGDIFRQVASLPEPKTE